MVNFWKDSWLEEDESIFIHTPRVATFDVMVVKDFYILGTRVLNV